MAASDDLEEAEAVDRRALEGLRQQRVDQRIDCQPLRPARQRRKVDADRTADAAAADDVRRRPGPRLCQRERIALAVDVDQQHRRRSEEHTSDLQSLMRISYAVFCLNKKNNAQT